jgi:hypothetical protein
MTLGGAVSNCFASVGNLGDDSVALFATEFTMGGVEILFFVNVKDLYAIGFFEPHKSGILMTGETAVLIQAKRVAGPEGQKINCEDQGEKKYLPNHLAYKLSG